MLSALSTRMPMNAARTTRLVPMLGIVLAHLIFFYGLLHAKMNRPEIALPREITISLIQTAYTKQDIPKSTPHPRERPNLQQLPVSTAVEIPTFVVAPAADNVIQTSTPQHTAVVANSAERHSATTITTAPATKLISAVEYLHSPQADYPPLARRMGEEGKVIMRVLVNEKGQAEKVDIQKSSGFNRLDEAARLAVMRALFKPYVEDGKPLMVLATAVVSFSLSS